MANPNGEKIQINSDMGESLGLHSFGNDEALMAIIDEANVACGFHAGDPDTLDTTVALAKENGVKVGAHPGLPDLVGFGRRAMNMRPDEVENLIHYQVGALSSFLKKHDVPLNHIKPHGALYSMLAKDAELARAAMKVAKVYGVPLMDPQFGEQHHQYAKELGVTIIEEVYVDMDYDGDGNLITLRHAQKTDPEAAAARIRRVLQDGKVETTEGTLFSPRFSAVCVHSDGENAVEVAQAVRAAVDEAAQ